ncbi:MAG: PIN domain-containing protein [Candidatus Dormibacteraceae bacterium]
MAVLIDTSFLVAAEREDIDLDQALPKREQYAISVIVAAELLHAVHRANDRQAQIRSSYVENLLARFSAIPLDLPIARSYARISAELARKGSLVNANDLWIGATAIAKGFSLLTVDGDFNRIPGLTRFYCK